jgi:hypothetical protein
MKLPDIFFFFLTFSVLLEMMVIKKRFISEQLNDSTLRHSSNHPLINIIEWHSYITSKEPVWDVSQPTTQRKFSECSSERQNIAQWVKKNLYFELFFRSISIAQSSDFHTAHRARTDWEITCINSRLNKIAAQTRAVMDQGEKCRVLCFILNEKMSRSRFFLRYLHAPIISCILNCYLTHYLT